MTPFDDNLQAPLDNWLPDLNGVPRHAIHIRMENIAGETAFKASVVRDLAVEDLTSSSVGYERFLTASVIRRDTFEFRLSRRRLSFGMPDFGFRWVDADVPDMAWSQGIVQFGHRSYNPTKGAGSNGGGGPGSGSANTWHWDKVSIVPAVPFTMLRADQRFVDATTLPHVTLAGRAPPGAHLRFLGIGNDLEVSFDDGASWQPAERQAQTKGAEEHFKSFWTPIPPGVDRVLIRGANGWFGPWMARDIAVWSPAMSH